MLASETMKLPDHVAAEYFSFINSGRASRPNLKLVIENNIRLVAAPCALITAIRGELTIDNPRWIENQRMGRSNFRTPLKIFGYQRLEDGSFKVPRGYGPRLVNMLRAKRIPFTWEDRRRELPCPSFSFTGRLRDYQEKAVRAILKKDFGTLATPTGSGKTVMGLAIIAARKQPALIIVHTRELLNQWQERIESFLEIPKAEIGLIENGGKRIGEKITVALVQSLYKCAGDVAPHIGHVVVDECHRAPSRTFSEAVTAFDCKYMLGLSATPYRRDGLTPLIHWYVGDVVHEIKSEGLVAKGSILEAEIIYRETDFDTNIDASRYYPKVLSELTQDDDRNRLIASDVSLEAVCGETCLILTDRKSHCRKLQLLLQSKGIAAEVLTGDVPHPARQAIVEKLSSGKIKVLIATGQLIGEGFDCRALSALFLATPVKFGGRVLQYVGRVLRPAPFKTKPKVYDYQDVNVPVLMASARARMKAYNPKPSATRR